MGDNVGILYGALGFNVCIGSLLLLYNLVAIIGFAREKTDESASGLAKGAWIVGVLSIFLGPCGWFFALIAMVLANVERRRMYQEKSPLASGTPVRMASVNGAAVILMTILAMVGGLGTYFAGSAG